MGVGGAIVVAFSESAGAWCGIAAPLLLGTYLAVGAKIRHGYDRTRDTITALGDGVDVVAFGFLVINIAVGVLLFLFARFTIRPEFKDVWLLVAAAAVGSALIGVTAGNKTCFIPGFYGRPVRWFHGAHVIVTLLNIGLMGAVAPGVRLLSDVDNDSFRVVNAVIAVASPIILTAAVLMSLGGRRQLRQRLIRTGRHDPPTKAPWTEPMAWLDRYGLAERVVFAVGYCWVVAAAVDTLRPGWVVGATIAFAVLAALAVAWPQRIVPVVRFSVESCQQNTVYGLSRQSCGEVRFLTITDVGAFRTSLRRLLLAGSLRGDSTRPRTTTDTPAHTLTIGFTHGGLTRLGEPYRWGGPRPDVFAEGMAKRRHRLGDRAEDWNGRWANVHVGAWAYARDEAALQAARRVMDRLEGVREAVRPIATRTARDVDASLLRAPDGISQPWVLGVPPPRRRRKPADRRQWYRRTDPLDGDPRGGGKLGVWRRWQPLALGEFVVGQVDESRDLFPVPDPAPLFIGGTFAAVRQLEFRADVFDTLLDDLVRPPAPLPDRASALARVLGRREDGMPLIPTEGDRNRFRYRDDLEGRTCPITAHIRRANPRDAIGFDGALANRRRMIRRGMHYVAHADPDGPLTGLLFISLQARLDDQFEFVQRSWLNDGAAFGIGRDPDPIAGRWRNGRRQVVLPGDAGPSVAELEQPVFVCRGGGYFLVPSIRGLYYLVRQAAEQAQ